jgi:hypothetical protein
MAKKKSEAKNAKKQEKPQKKEEPKKQEKETKKEEKTEEQPAGEAKEEKAPEGGGEGEDKPRTIGDIVEEEGLVSEPDRESMLGQEKVPELSEVLMRIDRIDGKLELFKGMLDSFGERMIEINERLGDTRRMVFDREKWASKLETDFDKVQGIVKELDPEKIVMKFEKFNADISKQGARLERTEDLSKNLSERLKTVEKKVADIKSIENIMKAGEAVEEKLKQVDESKRYVDKVTAKVEAMFMETNENMAYMKKNLDSISKHDTMIQDLLKEIESLKFQADQELASKRDVEEMVDSARDIIVEEVVGINPAAFDNLRSRVTLMENQNKSNKELEDELKKYNALLDRVERDFQMGRVTDETRDDLKSSAEKKIDEIRQVLEQRHGGRKKETKKEEKPAKPEKLKDKLLRAGKEKKEE